MADEEDKKTVPVRQDSDAPDASTSEASEKPPAGRRVKWRAVAWGLFAAAMFAGGAMLFPMLQESLSGLLGAAPEGEAVLESIEGRIAALEGNVPQNNTAIDSLRRRVGVLENTPLPAAVDDGLARRMAKLEQDMLSLEGVPGRVGLDRELAEEAERLRADLDALIGRVDTNSLWIEDLLARPASRGPDAGVAFFMAIGELRRQIDAGAPYGRALSQVADLVAGDTVAAANSAEALSTLSEYADAGAATLQVLTESLGPAADAAIAAPPPGEEPAWWQQVWGKLRGLVKVRRVGDAPGYTPVAISARAAARFTEGDIEGAAREMKSLEDLAPEAAAWARAAEAHMAVRAALDELERTGFTGATGGQ